MTLELRQLHSAKARLAEMTDDRIARVGTKSLLTQNEDYINGWIDRELVMRSLEIGT